jgi:hypothetical protein
MHPGLESVTRQSVGAFRQVRLGQQREYLAVMTASSQEIDWFVKLQQNPEHG